MGINNPRHNNYEAIFKAHTSVHLEIDDIDGSQVAEVYYIKKNLQRIVKYCEKDVISIIQLMLKFKCMELIPDENIEIVE